MHLRHTVGPNRIAAPKCPGSGTAAIEPVVPEMHRRVLPALGTPTLQRVAFESEQLRGAKALSAAAADYRARLSVPTARPRCRAQKPDLPAIDDDELVTRQQRVDVAWELAYNRRGGGQLANTFWCPGRITRVRSDSRDGWIYVEYDDDKSSGWLLASRPSFWIAEKSGAWRFEVTEDADARTATRTTRGMGTMTSSTRTTTAG